MKKIQSFIKESYDELLHKVSWPTWDELQSSAVIVAVATLIIALIVFGMDGASRLVLSTFYKAF